MLFRRPIACALGINGALLALFILFGVVRYGSLDDYFMAATLTGVYGSEYDPHFVFVNATLGYLLKPFYIIFPAVGWFYIFELLSVFAAFSIFSFFIIRRLGPRWGIPFAFLISSSSIDFYAGISFTQCAALLVASGGLLFFFGCRENRSVFLYAGIALVVLGAMTRWQMFLLGIPFILSPFLFEREPFSFFQRKNVVTLLLCVAAILSLRYFDEQSYADNDYKYYREYQWKRSFFGDGAHYDIDGVYDELEERGMSAHDFQLLRGWSFYDTDVFCLDSLDSIIKVANHSVYPINWRRMPAATLLAISNAFTKNLAWNWFFVCILLLLFSDKRKRMYPWYSLTLCVGAYFYLLSLNRLANHVEMGMWVYAFAMGVPLLKGFPLKSAKMTCVISLFAVAILILNLSCLPKVDAEGFLVKTPSIPQEWKDFLTYANEHPENAYLLSFARYKELGMFKDPAYKAAQPGSWQNIFTLGYWNINHPAMKRELAKRGVANPLRDIVKDNVYLIETENIPEYVLFYQEHYHKNLTVDTVKAFGDLMVLKYREVIK